MGLLILKRVRYRTKSRLVHDSKIHKEDSLGYVGSLLTLVLMILCADTWVSGLGWVFTNLGLDDLVWILGSISVLNVSLTQPDHVVDCVTTHLHV